MALSSSRLSTAIHTILVSKFGTPQDDTELVALCDSIAQAVVTEVTTNAVVTASSGHVTGLDSLGAPITLGTLTAGVVS